MTRAHQIKYFSEREKNILSDIKNFCHVRDPEYLHGLRVEIKKIKALVQMLEKCSKEVGFREILLPLKKVFKHAGEIREKILIRKLLDRYKVKNKNFRRELSTSIRKGSGKFYEREKIYCKIVQECGLFLPAKFQKIKAGEILRAYQKEIKKLDDFFSSPENAKHLHEKRKKIKELLYFSHALPEKTVKKIGLDESYLDRLQEKMGDWHDVILAQSVLKKIKVNPAIRKKISAEEKKLLVSVRRLSEDFAKKCR